MQVQELDLTTCEDDVCMGLGWKKGGWQEEGKERRSRDLGKGKKKGGGKEKREIERENQQEVERRERSGDGRWERREKEK